MIEKMMMKSKIFVTSTLVAALVACGGGGGDPGAPTVGGGAIGGGGGGSTDIRNLPTLAITLSDSNGAATNSVTGSAVMSANARLLDAKGQPLSGVKVSFTADDTLVKLTPAASALTNAAGVATVQLVSTSLTSAGASSLTASAVVDGKTVSSTRDFQVSAVNLSLVNLNLGSGPLAAFGNRPISVTANADGAPVTSAPVQVTFTASCGKVEPASVSTNAAGMAGTTYSADDVRCSGSNVTISASATGAKTVTGSIQVQAATPTNIQFVGASPSLIYLAGTAAATQSQVTFKVVDATGSPLQNQALSLSLVNAGPGVSLSIVGNAAPVTLTTNAAGVVSVPVFSGTVPTSVQVRAVAAGNPNLNAISNTLTVASGRPVQKAMSLSLEKFSIEGFNVDGATSEVLVSLADRQGNPVPDGTEVNLVAQSGVLIPARCVVGGGTSACSVAIRSQGTRPGNGRVQILAYVPGEEDFVDANFNNVYDAGEQFSDLGNAYRDDNENGQYDMGEFTVPRAGSSPCAGGTNGRQNTCDGQWGTVDVRRQTTIVFATSEASFSTPVISANNSSITVSVSDANPIANLSPNPADHNSLPAGTTISAEFLGGAEGCTVKKTTPDLIGNRFGAITVNVDLDKCQGGGTIGITTTTPGKVSTTLRVTLPNVAPAPTPTPTPTPAAPTTGSTTGS